MTPDIKIGIIQVLIAVFSIFLTPIASNAISRIQARKRHGISIQCYPTSENKTQLKSWLVRVGLRNCVADSGRLTILPAKVRNHFESANEIRTTDGPKHIKLRKNGVIEIDTKSLGEFAVIKFHAQMHLSDYVTAYLDDKPIECVISRFRYDSDKFKQLRFGMAYFLVLAKWRMTWIVMAFASYALASLLRIIYLGMFN